VRAVSPTDVIAAADFAEDLLRASGDAAPA
jgi:hypothetical protein